MNGESGMIPNDAINLSNTKPQSEPVAEEVTVDVANNTDERYEQSQRTMAHLFDQLLERHERTNGFLTNDEDLDIVAFALSMEQMDRLHEYYQRKHKNPQLLLGPDRVGGPAGMLLNRAWEIDRLKNTEDHRNFLRPELKSPEYSELDRWKKYLDDKHIKYTDHYQFREVVE
ncbi:MAG: hypothetical protein WCO23_05450 [bacterium]